MAITEVTSLQHFEELIAKDVYTIFDFWASWCGPCRAIAPTFKTLSEELGDKLEFYKVNVDEQAEVSSKAEVRAMPTFQLYKNGKKVDALVGANISELKALVAKAEASTSPETEAQKDGDETEVEHDAAADGELNATETSTA